MLPAAGTLLAHSLLGSLPGERGVSRFPGPCQRGSFRSNNDPKITLNTNKCAPNLTGHSYGSPFGCAPEQTGHNGGMTKMNVLNQPGALGAQCPKALNLGSHLM